MEKYSRSNAESLRQKAEEKQNKRQFISSSIPSEGDALKLFHELEVYKIELEMQEEEFQEAENQLERFSNNYIELYDYAPSGYFTLTQKGKIIELNLNGAKLLGKERHKLKNISFIHFMARESWANFHLFFEKLFKTKCKETCEVKLLLKNKAPIHALLSGIVSGNEEYCFVTVIDISDRKQAEEEITMLSQSLKSIHECVSITDLDHKILFVNESFLKTYGYEFDELMGKNISLVGSQNNGNSKFNEPLSPSMSGDWQGELFQRRKDGSEFPIYLSTSNIKDKGNKVIGLIGVAKDISGRKRAEKELIEAKEHAEESDRLKSAFLANMSHEVRTPLNSIIGFSELLEDPDFKPEQKTEFIHQIIDNGNNLLNIIQDILDISKLESGEIHIHMGQINAWKFITGVWEQFSFQAAAKKLDFKLSLPDTDQETIIITDPYRLHQVLNNLINNAMKFTLIGSIEIGFRLCGQFVEFFVRDTGIGIPVKYHKKIFDRFRQVEDAKTRSFGGNGLGLAITKNLVELMGGKIGVESEPGRGSAFYFTMPCQKEPKGQPRSEILENIGYKI